MPIDYKRYPPDWKTRIIPEIIARAGNKCECCGLQNKAIVFAAKFWVREVNRYKHRTFWFSRKEDAVREAGYDRLVKPVKVVLTIAHLDHDETNWQVSLERLKAMCQICHLRYDAKEKYLRSFKKLSQ